MPAPRPSIPARPSLKDYHASLSTHLSSILREEISGSAAGDGFPLHKPGGQVQNQVQLAAQVQAQVRSPSQPLHAQPRPQPQPQGKMYTDLKALAERDKEHLTAWYLEGYKRYIGGVNEGFVLLRGDDQDPIKDPQEVDLDLDQTMRGRKRRYTEEPGLIERRRKVLRMSLEQGRLDAVKTQRSGSADERLRQEARARSGVGAAMGVLGSKEGQEQGEMRAGHYVSPLITPGLAFVPTPFEEMTTNPQRAGGMNFGQAVGRKSMAMSSGGSSGGSITGNNGGNHGGFNLGQPPANRGALEERRMRKRAMTGSSSGSGSGCGSTSMSISGSGSGSGSRGVRQWVSPTLTMTHMTSKAKRPTMPSTPSTGSLAFVSASHLNIALPTGSSPVYMGDHQQHHHQQHHQHQQHQQYQQQHAGRSRQNSMADAALGTTSSAGLTSLTAASLGCRAHEGLTGGSSGLLAGAHLAMTDMSTPALSQGQKEFDDEKSFARECGFDPVTPGSLSTFGMGEEMAHGDPRDAVEISSPAMPPDYSSHAFAQRSQGASGQGLGLVDEMMSKARPSMLQRATSSYMNPDRWALPTPGSEGTTPVDVAWDKWLRADDDTPAPTS